MKEYATPLDLAPPAVKGKMKEPLQETAAGGGGFIRLLEETDEGPGADGLEPLQGSGGTVLVDVAGVAVGSGVG
jgi:hypothetical protein